MNWMTQMKAETSQFSFSLISNLNVSMKTSSLFFYFLQLDFIRPRKFFLLRATCIYLTGVGKLVNALMRDQEGRTSRVTWRNKISIFSLIIRIERIYRGRSLLLYSSFFLFSFFFQRKWKPTGTNNIWIGIVNRCLELFRKFERTLVLKMDREDKF